MKPSTASFIAYDLRPSKQAERRILMDLIKIAGDCGLPLSDYRYVGMGGNKFYDFMLMHKYIGLKDMVSLERDPVMFERAKFNVPYNFIDVRHETVAEYLQAIDSGPPLVLWLDYDDGISVDVIADIASVGTKSKVGDFCFVTIYGGPPGVLERINDDDRLAWFVDVLGDVTGDVRKEDVGRATFPRAVHKVLMSAFNKAFAARRDGKFHPFLQVQYSDSVAMLTVGGGFLADGQSV